MMPADKEFSSSTDVAKYFLNLPDSKLTGDKTANMSKTTIYLQGNNFATDDDSPDEGKTSTIINTNKGMFYMVSWPHKSVMQMSVKDMKEMQKKAIETQKEEMKKLSPKMRKQIEEDDANKKSQNGYKTKFTGKERKINGFDCKQYMIEHGEDVKMVWAADDNKGLGKHIESITNMMKSVFTSGEEEKDEWELLPGKIPIEVRSFYSGMDGSQIVVGKIKKISEEKPPAGKFMPPGKDQGFTTRSLKEMMMQMQGNMKKQNK